ncbi:anaphase-promoting complex subunit 7 isoform X2 [Elaeis guineensis]|uniref:Anaphase-promoting complex subunit 7 isoform X1 n=1 Tax=Elaeis guineensis var. tenera TaxID=51953 RepID=A0A6I9RS83_ELAGV|nr:anaphase-promoting complex subunit 7 isoform X1 [Elaeis guineensis]
MEVPKDQMTTLLDNGLYDSAQLLGCFLVSSAITNIEANPYVKVENLVLQGDALFGEKEFRRALSMYKQALQHCKVIPKQTTNYSRSSLSTSSRSSSPNSINASAINENEVKFKIALCYCALSENRAALLEMEGIPPKARTLRMNLTLGKLYRISRHSRSAIACYKDCLRHSPYILEAITALAELGISSKEILSLFPQTPNRGGRPPFDHMDAPRWLHLYVEAQCCIASNDYKGGLDLFSELLQRFPNNVHIMLEIAKVEAVIGRNDEAIMNFEKVRSVDPYVMTYMDEYAMLLKSKSDQAKLNKLVHDLLNIDSARAEVFVALSALWERKDERRALSYAEKSLRTDDRNISGYIMKGNLYLSLNRPDVAATAFRAAQELRPDLRSYQGLVRSYLALSKSKEALFTAREAMKVMPQSAKALKLVGDVHASSSGGREKARKFYESALRLESGFLGAALALAELHVVEGRNKDAVSLLERYLKDWADDSLHIKLAQVFAASNMLSDALSHYQAALRINPQNEAAKKGLDRLEKQMKGMDPDAPEDEEENEAEDAEGDHEETELL